jgi:hypothetical protein
LRRGHPRLRKTVFNKLAATVAAVIQTQTANMAPWAVVLPRQSERADMRLQWIARLLAKPLLDSRLIMEPFDRHRLNKARANGQVIVLSMDQTDLGDRFAALMLGVRLGARALLEIVSGWLPAGAAVLLGADRFYPSAALIQWLAAHAWEYRLRLTGKPCCRRGPRRGDLFRGLGTRPIASPHRQGAAVRERHRVQHWRVARS